MSASEFSVGIVQCYLNNSKQENVEKIETYIIEAAKAGTQIILTPELFEGPYFPQLEKEEIFDLAQPIENPTLKKLQKLAKEFRVVLPYSFFERDNQEYYNSVSIINSLGELMGVYRKSHIPDGPGYEEKFYFKPGNTGFKTWDTEFATIGVGICWDQWFPECARAMTLMGAECLLYPTAIGSEPSDPDEHSKDPWQRAMVGHAVSNSIPVAAANRIGKEQDLQFYGSSFIADPRGDILMELDSNAEGFRTCKFDKEKLRLRRANWGFFRDRRPDMYSSLVQ